MEFLQIKFGTSRAKDTYGMPRVTLTEDNGKRYTVTGCGYDLIGTLLAQWLTTQLSQQQLETAMQANLYGVFHKQQGYYLNGACGEDCMIKIAEHCGLKIKSVYNNRKLQGFTVETQDI